MATATATRKPRGKKAESNGKAVVSKGNAKFDADQKAIDGMEDEKIPALDTCIKRIIENERTIENAKSAIEVEQSKLEPLMKKNDVDTYSAHGRQLVVVQGTPKVLIKKIKDK